MAINMNSPDSSPRISFSHDLQQENPTQTNPKHDTQTIRLDNSLLSETSPDFNFCLTYSETETNTCPADELFFNGVIIPTKMRDKITNEEFNSMTKSTPITEKKIAISDSKSFWGVKRSSSLNCEKQRNSIWASFPVLLRSKSTGSSLIGNKNNPKEQIQNNLAKKLSNLPPQYQRSSSSSSSSSSSGKNSRNYSSVLTVRPPYIAKGTSDLLGLATFFGNGLRDKKNKK